jgi:glucose/arabinose dehydrogenase
VKRTWEWHRVCLGRAGFWDFSGGKFKIVGVWIFLAGFLASNSSAFAQEGSVGTLVPHSIHLRSGKSFSLNLPEEFEIGVAAEGLRRVRFMAKAPDGRLFATDMYSRADNKRGTIYILDGFDERIGKFAKVIPYLRNLRNPNSIAFYTDPRGQQWLYVALTEKLVRFRFWAGDVGPEGEPEVLGMYPDYGLNYKYGGWHLTRTIAFGEGENRDKLFISVGSSCNACEEKEEIRATLSVMDADGKSARILARGLRNAVGMKIVDGALYLTNMGADHLGGDAPDDTMFRIDGKALAVREERNYGWPYCYFESGKGKADGQFSGSPRKVDCGKVPEAFATFAAHGSPLGVEYFDATTQDEALRDSFLVALHGSSKKSLKRGYSVVRVREGGKPEQFLTGFLKNGTIYGRPCGIFRVGPDSFLLTDDFAGVIYYIHKR